ncbi:sigma-70 family RNA polymerase sigma factor [Porcipelethomonas sp.]|uniref:sigma-70 family RNA polymerase sigma factor n=1 Tax=Porcipelethomonas sp. TaxID=2981675 RepID=UPI003EFA7D9A
MNYLSEIPRLTDEEFLKLLSEYKETGDISVRNKLVLSYGYIAQVSAMQLRGAANTNAQIEDMVNQGMITLIDCIDKFDPEKGIKFESYAYMRVRGGIIDMIRRQDWIPRRVRVNSKKINETYNQLCNELRREPTSEEIAAKMGISVEKFEKYNSEMSNSAVYSFEELIQNVSQMGNVLENSTMDDITPEKKVLKDEMRKVLKEAIDELSERERLVISLYYYENLNLSDIAKILDVSIQRISQINSRAVTKLKNKLNGYLVN